jgi:hypothetical protein
VEVAMLGDVNLDQGVARRATVATGSAERSVSTTLRHPE